MPSYDLSESTLTISAKKFLRSFLRTQEVEAFIFDLVKITKQNLNRKRLEQYAYTGKNPPAKLGFLLNLLGLSRRDLKLRKRTLRRNSTHEFLKEWHPIWRMEFLSTQHIEMEICLLQKQTSFSIKQTA